MANVITGRVMKLDTVATVLATSVSIRALHYAGGTTAGHTAVLTDGADNHIATLSCGGNGFSDHIDLSNMPQNMRTWTGLKVASLGSGVVTLYRG